MSTKIYYAWRWNKGYDELLKWLNKLLSEDYTLDGINFIAKGLHNITKENKFQKISELMKIIPAARISPNKGEPFDIDLSCVVYQNEGDIVIQFFGLSEYKFPNVYKQLYSLPSFDYWNNTDPEEGISEEEWEYRSEWFDRLFDKFDSDTPSKCGLVYVFNNDFDIISRAVNKVLDGNT